MGGCCATRNLLAGTLVFGDAQRVDDGPWGGLQGGPLLGTVEQTHREEHGPIR